MRHVPYGDFLQATPDGLPRETSERLAPLLSATMKATDCTGVAILIEHDQGYRCLASAGLWQGAIVEVDCSPGTTWKPSYTVQNATGPAGEMPLQVQVDGQILSCFVAASPFTRAGGARGLLLVADARTDRRLSSAQTYVIEAQAAHCGTVLDLADIRRDLERGTQDDAQSQRLRLLESVAVHARDSIVITEAEPLDLPGPRILFCNAAFTRATGYDADEVLGKTPRILQGPDTSPEARQMLREAFAAWKPVEVELINYHKDGTPFWVELSIAPVANEAGWFTHWVSVQRDITDRRAAEKLAMRMRMTELENEALENEIEDRRRVESELLYTAFHDSLTRLRNRAFFMDRLEAAIARHRSGDGDGCAILFLDLDRFKVVNDSLGHVAGDTLLKEIARRLRDCTRTQDTLARIGGDEFALLIEDAGEPGVAIAAAERIIATMRSPIRLGRHEVFPACSIGIALSLLPSRTSEALLRDADIAMYEAKRVGGTYAVFDASMHASAVAKLELQTDLRLAVERNELVVVYQPIMSLPGRQVSGFEALLRWNHPEHGVIQPAAFIDAAEEIGLIRQIDRMVRAEACRQLKAWQIKFNRPDLRMSVNASASEFANPRFAADLKRLLAELGVDPPSMQLEITEGIFLDPNAAAMGTIEQVRQSGVQIALDDFGTGYSSLSYINRYPIDTIKIDRSFVTGMIADKRTLAVVELIVNLSRRLDIAIVAEGVETAGQEAMLASMGCGFGQGYYFAKPQPAVQAGSLLER